jgi:hypothetical protein
MFLLSLSLLSLSHWRLVSNNELLLFRMLRVPIFLFLSLSLSRTTTASGVVCCSYLIYSGRYGHPSEWGQYVPGPATPFPQNGRDEVVADDNDDKQSNLETKAEKWDICMEGADLVAEMVLSSPPLPLSSPTCLWDDASSSTKRLTLYLSSIHLLLKTIFMVFNSLLLLSSWFSTGDGRFSSSSWSGCGKSIASAICEIFCTSHVP